MRRSLVDTIACAFGGLESDTARFARRAVERLAPAGPANVLGGGTSTADLAGFANGVAVRYLDLNDVYLGPREGIHPSDCTAAVVAVAEAEHSSGSDLTVALAIAYEVLCRLIDTVELMTRGWDGVSLCAIASAVATSRLLSLSETQAQAAINIAAVDAPALLRTRVGQLSKWKAAAGPNSARQGVLAAYLAAEGMTGPSAIFEGKHGLRSMLAEDLGWPRTFEWRTLRVRLKRYPAMYFIHSAVVAALELAARGVEGTEIKSLEIRTFPRAGDERFSEDKWAPATRETADHSLPYCTAVALLDGELTAAQFTNARIRATDVRTLMSRTRVVEEPGFAILLPDKMPCRLVVETQGGSRVEAACDTPPGHPDLPMSDGDISDKFAELAREAQPEHAVSALVQRLWTIESSADVAGLLAVSA